VTTIPATVWAGALTPELTTKLVHGLSIDVPTTGDGSYSMLQPVTSSELVMDQCFNSAQANGTFTTCPSTIFAGNMLLSAGSTTTTDGSTRNHSKFDGTNFGYIGRSYGVGASAGLTDQKLAEKNSPLSYSYFETGYITSSQCIYNDSSSWNITDAAPSQDGVLPDLFVVRGYFPNSNWSQISQSGFEQSKAGGLDYYAQVAFDSSQIVAIGSHNSDSVSRYFIAIAAGSAYAQLDTIQCELFFQPTNFTVSVSLPNRTVSVLPVGNASDPEPRGILRSKVMFNLNMLSMVDTSLYTSTVGDALINNVHNMQDRQNFSLSAPAPNDTVLAAVEASFTAMADDILVSLGAAMLSFNNSADVSQRIVELVVPAVMIGSPGFVIAALATNFIGVLFVIVAAAVSRFWTKLPIFDFNDVGCMVLGVVANDTMAPIPLLRFWNGDPEDKMIGSVSAKLDLADDKRAVKVVLR
jgi:hypothetical protein